MTQIVASAEQARRIRALVESGMTPDDAMAKVIRTPPSSFAAPSKPKPNKYGAVRQEADGYKFASTKEMNHYHYLKLMLKDHAIKELVVHPVFRFEHNGVKIGRFTPDFAYTDTRTGEYIVVDVKGGRATKTEAYGLRKKLLKAFFDIDITEV